MTDPVKALPTQHIPQGQISVEVVNEDDIVDSTLQLNENDPIFASSFESLIKEAFAEGKHFFLAKIISRQDQSNETNSVQM